MYLTPGVRCHRSVADDAYPRSTMADSNRSWTFLTNHAHVLLCIARNPEARLRDIADQVGIGERATHGIITDLVEAGYVKRAKVGRRNHYSINPKRPLRHPMERHHSVGELLDTLAPEA